MGTVEGRLIEGDEFPFEFLSQLAERESWRKEIHRPVYHVHKWWAKRLGSVFRGILLGCELPNTANLADEFYRPHDLSRRAVFDPFMGSGTTIGEAHKLGFSALGRDINPVAVNAVTTAFGPLDRRDLLEAFEKLQATVGRRIRSLYRSVDRRGRPCEVLYFFWVMQTKCAHCAHTVDLFSTRVMSRNAYPNRKPEVQIICPQCGDIFPGMYGQEVVDCSKCGNQFDATRGAARGTKAWCNDCEREFAILGTMAGRQIRPAFRLYGKLVLTLDGDKEYLPATTDDLAAYDKCSTELNRALEAGEIVVPDLPLEQGHNTRQAISYGFTAWREFFNDRQLLALCWLREAILALDSDSARGALATLFSGVLEFNNLFASFKGEGTGAVRHMFSHHILKPERMPIEAHVWGTPKSSGSFSSLFPSRLLRTIKYRETPTEVNGRKGAARACSPAFSGRIEPQWPTRGDVVSRGIYLSCGDSATTGLADQSIDYVVTDPPFFDNVHYSELADFFYAWQKISDNATTRNPSEVQDADAERFADKLTRVFQECHRVLKNDGLLVFTYHHSRSDAWNSLAIAILGAGFVVVNSHPVKAEMSVATPKSQAKEPIQFDIILVCRKLDAGARLPSESLPASIESAQQKSLRLQREGFELSRNDFRIILFGQLLTLVRTPTDFDALAATIDIDSVRPLPKERRHRIQRQKLLFDQA